MRRWLHGGDLVLLTLMGIVGFVYYGVAGTIAAIHADWGRTLFCLAWFAIFVLGTGATVRRRHLRERSERSG